MERFFQFAGRFADFGNLASEPFCHALPGEFIRQSVAGPDPLPRAGERSRIELVIRVEKQRRNGRADFLLPGKPADVVDPLLELLAVQVGVEQFVLN